MEKSAQSERRTPLPPAPPAADGGAAQCLPPTAVTPVEAPLAVPVPTTMDHVYATGVSVPTEPSVADAMPNWPQIDGYHILGELGRGGIGVVYKARQLGLNRLVALKMILSGSYAGDRERARFRTEAEAVARLQHANIVQIH